MIWTQAKKDQLAALYGTMPMPKIAEILGCSKSSASQKATRMGLRERKWAPKRRWTTDEVAYVKRTYGPYTAYQIAQQLGRTRQSVYNIAARLKYL